MDAIQGAPVKWRWDTPESPRKTPTELARVIWDIFEANPHFGRNRIANTIWLLGVFVAASTVRNVLLRPKPRTAPSAAKAQDAPATPREIVARYPNHVWSVDRTRMLRWGLWPTWLLVAVDHLSRAVMAVVPLEGSNAGWVVDALEEAFSRHGPPKHLISDQEEAFISEVLADLLHQWKVKHRFGAVGRHGSIAVTERVILTLKYEWLKRVPVIRGLDHLDRLLRDFAVYYNDYRGHTTLEGAVPAVMYWGERWDKPEKSAKTLPTNLERRVFPDNPDHRLPTRRLTTLPTATGVASPPGASHRAFTAAFHPTDVPTTHPCPIVAVARDVALPVTRSTASLSRSCGVPSLLDRHKECRDSGIPGPSRPHNHRDELGQHPPQ